MCYSAQVVQSLRDYLRTTGALPDYAQIERILEQRLADPRVRIPRGFERNFDNPSTDADKRVRGLIDQYLAAATMTLEQKLFKEKKRLADAERKLQVKETKKALEDKRIASNWIETSLEKLSLQKGTQPHEDDDRIFPFTYAPIVIQMDGLYNARRDNLTRFWRKEFGATHALMIVDSFFENVQLEGKNEVLHFTPQDRHQMFVACLYGEWTGPEGDLLSFAAVTDDPPPEIAAAGHDRCVINMRPENFEAWLTPQGRSDDELQAILSDRQKPYYEHEVMAA